LVVGDGSVVAHAPLDASHDTARIHMLNVLGKLDINSRMQAVVFTARCDHIRP
jgi:DNA-binding CsgD family transcriptional regulator